jgi:hypothetical protein
MRLLDVQGFPVFDGCCDVHPIVVTEKARLQEKNRQATFLHSKGRRARSISSRSGKFQ